MTARPTITDAPGLTWKPRRNGLWEARWAARTDLVKRGYKPKSIGLWTGLAPTPAEAAMISDRCHAMQSDMLVWARGGIPQVAIYDGTWSSLIACYRTDEDSTYRDLCYRSRRHYDQLCKTLEISIGADHIRNLNARRVKRLHESWTAGGKIAIGHSLVGMVRTVLTFGATILECPDCRAAKVLLHDMRFAMAKPRVDRLTAPQVVMFRAVAHAEGRPSMALAQAIQFECTLRQKDVIGEWVPLDEPGLSDVTSGNDKWLRGIRWEEIDSKMILKHVTSKRQKELEVNLTLAPMVVEELCRMFGVYAPDLTRDRLPASGPVVRAERSQEPWKAHEFRRLWRVLATKAGIPKSVRNMDSRAGAITEATDGGADLESVRHAATHGDIAMTQRYSRGSAGKIEDVMRLRAAHRNKSGTE